MTNPIKIINKVNNLHIKEHTTPEEYEKLKFFMTNPKLNGYVFRIGYKFMFNDQSVGMTRLAYATNPDKQEKEIFVVIMDGRYRMQPINAAFIYETPEQLKAKAKEYYETELWKLNNKWASIIENESDKQN